MTDRNGYNTPPELNGHHTPRFGVPPAAEIATLLALLKAELREEIKAELETEFIGPPAPEPPDHFLTLAQAAAVVRRKKRTLENYRRPSVPACRRMPPPDFPGRPGAPALWSWRHLRLWLEKTFNTPLPQNLADLTF